MLVLMTIPALYTNRIKQIPARHLAHFFLSDLFEGTAKPQNCRGKLEPKRNSTIIVLKQIQRPSMDENQM